MWHGDWINGLCLTCSRVCYWCNQCKCEIGRKRVCPGFNVKKDPKRFASWQLAREQAKEEDREYWREKHYGPRKDTVDHQAYADLYAKTNPDGTAYYDR